MRACALIPSAHLCAESSRGRLPPVSGPAEAGPYVTQVTFGLERRSDACVCPQRRGDRLGVLVGPVVEDLAVLEGPDHRLVPPGREVAEGVDVAVVTQQRADPRLVGPLSGRLGFS